MKPHKFIMYRGARYVLADSSSPDLAEAKQVFERVLDIANAKMTEARERGIEPQYRLVADIEDAGRFLKELERGKLSYAGKHFLEWAKEFVEQNG